MINPNEIFEKLRIAGEDWADKDAAASLLEESKNSLRSRIMLEAQASSMDMRRSIAEASVEYQDHISQMVEARRLATRARVMYDSARVYSEMIRTAESTRRQEIKAGY